MLNVCHGKPVFPNNELRGRCEQRLQKQARSLLFGQQCNIFWCVFFFFFLKIRNKLSTLKCGIDYMLKPYNITVQNFQILKKQIRFYLINQFFAQSKPVFSFNFSFNIKCFNINLNQLQIQDRYCLPMKIYKNNNECLKYILCPHINFINVD